jgi:hypothetical protein
MKSANKRFVQKSIAVVVIITLLYGAGVSPAVMFFISGVVLIVFLLSRKAQNREIERLFDFYVAADAILREDRRWFGFEVTEVLEQGHEALEGIPDPPPLQLFTIGALHHRVEQHAAAEEFLSRVVDEEYSDERFLTQPSAQLRRYVTLLRKIESEPSFAPQTLGAIRSLERMRRKNARALLAESRQSLEKLERAPQAIDAAANSQPFVPSTPMQVRPAIRDVLHDIYDIQQDKQSN